MPIYEYICDECQAHFERIVLNGATKVECPKCGSRRATQQLSRFSTPRSGAASASPPSDYSCTGEPSSCGRCKVQ